MDLRDKTIGFAMCGSRRTMILIQLNDCFFSKVGWVHKLTLRVRGCKANSF